MTGRSKLLQWTQVDAIPTFFVETGQTLRATLSFRVGMADESLATRGWTHLAEHLAMHELRRPAVLSNARVGGLVTEFVVAGEADEVVGFFAQLCGWLREPRLDHLEHERGILLAEGARRGRFEFDEHVGYRFGARGLGLLGYPELGLHQVSEEQVRSLVARSFVAGNASLALNGPPPPGLRLDLPDGPRRPLPASTPIATSPPYHFQTWTGRAAASGLCRGALESLVALELLTNRISTRLRDERGQSYATTGLVERVDATTLMVLVESNVTEEGDEGVVDVMHREHAALGTDGPQPAEVGVIRRHRLRALSDDLTGEWQATAGAHAHLRGEPPTRQDDLRAFLEDMTPASLTPTLGELADTLLVSSAAGVESRTELPFESGLPDLPAPVGGHTFPAALAPLDPSVLVVSDDILEVADAAGNVRRTSLRDCVALEKYADGGRVIWAGHGDVFRLEPTQWRDGAPAVLVVDRAVDSAVHLHLPARPPDERPRVPRFTLGQRLAVLADKPFGYAVLGFVTITGLGLAAALVVGTSNLPGGGSIGGLLLFAVAWAGIMTLLTKARRKESRPVTAGTAASEPEAAAAPGVSSRADRAVILVTRSCTTGWLDWVHGELWLAPDALIRRRLGLGRTVRQGAGPTVELPDRERPDRPQFAPETIHAGHRTNKHIRFDDIASARLRRGILNGRLSVTTHSGHRHKLLWLRADPAFEILSAALPRRIPGRLTFD